MRKATVKSWRDPVTETPVRERLLVATGELMAERDTIDVTIAEIAARADANVALVSYYFGGREGLLVALAKRDADDALGRLDKLMQTDLPPEEKLRTHIVAAVYAYFRRPYLNRLLHALIRDANPEVAREVGDFFVRPLAEARRKILRDGFKSGAFRKVDPIFNSMRDRWGLRTDLRYARAIECCLWDRRDRRGSVPSSRGGDRGFDFAGPCRRYGCPAADASARDRKLGIGQPVVSKLTRTPFDMSVVKNRGFRKTRRKRAMQVPQNIADTIADPRAYYDGKRVGTGSTPARDCECRAREVLAPAQDTNGKLPP